jgi:hypothetical protein
MLQVNAHASVTSFLARSAVFKCQLPAGAAMVYLYEIADPRYKAVTGSLGYISLGAGVVLGILVVAAIISAVPECE